MTTFAHLKMLSPLLIVLMLLQGYFKPIAYQGILFCFKSHQPCVHSLWPYMYYIPPLYTTTYFYIRYCQLSQVLNKTLIKHNYS